MATDDLIDDLQVYKYVPKNRTSEPKSQHFKNLTLNTVWKICWLLHFLLSFP